MGILRTFVGANRALCRRLAARFPGLATGGDYRGEVTEAIRAFAAGRSRARVLEAGGIDRPLLSRSPSITYHGLDIEFREGCIEVYDAFRVQSIEEPIGERYDLICSFTLLEHVRDNGKAFRSMHAALEPGGAMVHYVPNGLHPYSLLIRLLGPRRSLALLKRLLPETVGKSGYPAFFDRCTVSGMEALCRETGFDRVEISCYYRANLYFEPFFPAWLLVTGFEDLCRELGLRSFCSGFVLRARKRG